MLGELAVAYLFLGGAGAACVGVSSLADLLWLKEPFGPRSGEGGLSRRPAPRALALAFLAGFLLLVFGVLCLLFDLGKGDRALDIAFSGTLNLMTVGAYALVALGAIAALLAAVRWLYLPAVATAAVRMAEWVAVPAALLVMAYTGFLLQTLGGFTLWKNPFIPVLFVLSSASCGLALVLLACAFVASDRAVGLLGRTLVRADVAVIAAEAVATAGFLAQLRGSDHNAALAAWDNLVSGDQALVWWGGFVLCGMALPLVLAAGRVLARAWTRRSPAAITSVPPVGVSLDGSAVSRADGSGGGAVTSAAVAAALLVLAGGVCLRVAVVDAAEQPRLELQQLAVGEELGL